ncbi:MAG: glycosyltransferase family 2 protein [Ignavibacteriae bacterium]|nr:glycosyltransferase family 2 protein [Ignavibacteriota bacterium]
MKTKTEISIILPVFNRKNKIRRAVNSVLKQTYKNWELIIVDDGSSDGTEKAVFTYLKKYNNIRYTRHSNRGTAISLNEGIKLACGKFITFIDSDDEYCRNHLSDRIYYFRKYKDTELIHSTCKFIGSDADLLVPDAADTKKLIHLKDCVIGATFFGKADVFRKLNGFRNVYSYDSEFCRRAKRKFKIEKIDSPTYIYYRNSKDSVLTKMKNKIKKSDGK